MAEQTRPRARPDEFLHEMIGRIAAEEGVPKDLFRALISQESQNDPSAVSHKGAAGLTQLMPETARELGVTDLTDPEQQLRGGARYLLEQLDSFKNIPDALAAYNAGPNAVLRHGGTPPFEETQKYVFEILNRLEPDRDLNWNTQPAQGMRPRPRPEGIATLR